MAVAELWIRNPAADIRECVEVGIDRIVFDRGYCLKRKIDPVALCNLYFGEYGSYELMLVGVNGASHHKIGDDNQIIGVYPTWDGTYDSISFLEEYARNPVGENEDLCDDVSIGEETRPIFGQSHVVVAHNLPPLNTAFGKKCLQMLRDLQRDYPKMKLHIHGTYAFGPMVNMRFKSFDFGTSTDALKGNVYLPNGRKVKVATEIHRNQKWVSLLGFRVVDLQSSSHNRSLFNLKALKWACENGWNAEPFAIRKSEKDERPNIECSDADFMPITRSRALPVKASSQPGDMIECDTCSLAMDCRQFRSGAVCTLPNSQMSELAKMFDTTDSKTILTGLAKLTAMSANRAEKAIEFENDFGLDPETTKVLKQTFDFAERYAKLNDPALRANVNVNQNRDISSGSMPMIIDGTTVTVERLPNANDAARMAVEYYSQLGIEQKDITSEMMRDFLLRVMKGGSPAIEAGDPEPVEAEIVS